MRLRTAAHRAGIAALTAGLTAIGVLTLPTPASAASIVTLRVTTSSGDSVVANVSEGEPGHEHYCTRNVAVGVTTEIRVEASKGAWIQIYPSNRCYDARHPILGFTVANDGQVIEVKL